MSDMRHRLQKMYGDEPRMAESTFRGWQQSNIALSSSTSDDDISFQSQIKKLALTTSLVEFYGRINSRNDFDADIYEKSNGNIESCAQMLLRIIAEELTTHYKQGYLSVDVD